jgi:hypothetical protein
MTPAEQELFDFARGNLPDWYSDDDRANEFLGLAARIMGATKAVALFWLSRQTRILLADGPTSTTPDFLAQHALDRGTFRQLGESDDSLRARLRSMPAGAIVRPAIMATLVAAIPGAVALELPRDLAFTGVYAVHSGIGGTFAALAGGQVSFTPTAGYGVVPLPGNLVLSSATASGNNGTFATLGVLVNGATYANGSGVAGADAAVHWTLAKIDRRGNPKDGFARAYANRGFRVGGPLPTILVILPYGTTDSAMAIAVDIVRQLKAFGVLLLVERREVP